jgi:hypothetical protein
MSGARLYDRLKKFILFRKRSALIAWKILVQKEKPWLLNDTDLLKGVMLEEFEAQGFASNGKMGRDRLKDLIDKIVSRVSERMGRSPKESSYGERLKMSAMTAFQSAHGFWALRFAHLCGFMCIWELQFRLLVRRMDGETRVPKDDRSKKKRQMKTIEFLDLHLIIDNFKAAAPMLELNLRNIQDVRNPLLHGNFQAARNVVNNQISKKRRSRHEGGLLVFSMYSGEVTRPSDADTEDEIEAHDDFAWVMDVGMTELFETVTEMFERAIVEVGMVLTLKSMSFGDAEDMFEIIASRHEPMSDAERERFQKHLDSPTSPIHPDVAKNLLSDVQKLRKRKS